MPELPSDYDPATWDETTAVWFTAFEAGYRAAEEDFRSWAEDFTNSAPGAVAMPLEKRHAAVIQSLVDRATVGDGRPAKASRSNGRTWSPHHRECRPGWWT